MTTSYKPNAYTSVAPYLMVDDAEGTIDFLVRTFAATPLRRYPRDDGKLMHAEVRIDDTVVMLADAAPGWPAIVAHVHVYVPDVDAAYARALEAGATAVQAPVKKQDEDKRGGVQRGVVTWWIATKVE